MRCDEPGPDIFAFDVYQFEIAERKEINIKTTSLVEFEMLPREGY